MSSSPTSATGSAGDVPTRDRRIAFAASLGADPELRRDVAGMVESIELGSGRWWMALLNGAFVGLLLSVPLMAAAAVLVLAVMGPLLGAPGTMMQTTFLVLWIGSVVIVVPLVTRRTLRRLRQALAMERVRMRECVRCGSGVRGVAGPEDGILRCPECGETTIRRAGPAQPMAATGLPLATAAIAVLPEPERTLRSMTVAEPRDIDRLTVALAERHPDLGTPALLVAAAAFILGLVIGVPLRWVGLTVLAAQIGPPAAEGFLPITSGVLLLLGTIALAWWVFRARVTPSWRRAAITAIEANNCFGCRQPLPAVPGEDGWHDCRHCGFRTPGRRDHDDAADGDRR